MLSIAKLRTGAQRYYLETVARGREEYYTGAGESPGVWIGAGCRDLALAGEVTPEALHLVLGASSPVDGQPLFSSHIPPERRVAGFDLTFSAPKSVSLLYGLGSDAVASQVREAHHCAVADAISYLESHAALARRGSGGVNHLATSGFVAAGFTHRTSRSGDPQLHTHVLVANVVRASDGRWSSLHADPLYNQVRTAGFVYQAVLRHELAVSLGLSFGPVVKGAAEILGIPKALCDEFSSRRHEILARLDELGGVPSGRAREIATLDTRPAKDHSLAVDHMSLRERWLGQCREAGMSPPELEEIARRTGPPQLTQGDYEKVRSQLFGWEGLTESVSAFERRDVVRGVAEQLGDGASLDEIEVGVDALLRDPEAVPLERVGRAGEQLFTTKGMLEVEQRLMRDAIAMRGHGAVVTPEIVEAVLSERPSISDEQAEMVRHLTTSGDGLQVVIGKAGAGKTYALDAARAAFQRSGYVVCGTALSARAAAELESGAGIASCTLAKFMDLDNLYGIDDRTVIVLDEAGMVGTRDLQQLVFHAKRYGATVVLVGDDRQLPEIEAGGALGKLAKELDAVVLTENRRQHEPWEREALDELRHGEVREAVLAYSERGRIHLCDSAPSAQAAMVSDWVASRATEPSSRMYAIARADVAELNHLARFALRQTGELGDDLLTAGGRGYAEGDEVMFLRNDKRLEVMNGLRGVVTGVKDGSLVVKTDRGERVVGHDYLEAGHLDYGYASTVHKAQGATVARAFVLGSEAIYREAGYVAMSRAKERTDLYAITPAFDEGIAPGPEGLSRGLSISKAKKLAIESLDPRRAADLAAERERLSGIADDWPLDAPWLRKNLEAMRAREESGQGWPGIAEEMAAAEQRVAELEKASKAFEASHGHDLERLAEIEAGAGISDQLMGEALHHTTPDAGKSSGRDRAPVRRSAWARAVGAVQAKLQRALGREETSERGLGVPEPGRNGIDRAALEEELARERGRSRGLGL